MGNDICVGIRSSADIVNARQEGRTLALRIGFDGADVTLIAAAISEVARNIVDHSSGGRLILSELNEGGRRGISIVAQDTGPGIPDVARAMEYGYSTRKGLGVGLPGAKWLMDDFNIISIVGKGTTITMKKWFGWK